MKPEYSAARECFCETLSSQSRSLTVLDEYASMAPEAWTEVIRPALAYSRAGMHCLSALRAATITSMTSGGLCSQPDWTTFQFTTEQGGNVTREELESATHEMDERTFRQEFQASFENLGAGLVYYAFDRNKKNVELLRYKITYRCSGRSIST